MAVKGQDDMRGSTTKIDNTSRDVGAGKSPAPSNVRGGTPSLKTQLEIGGGLGNTVNDRG